MLRKNFTEKVKSEETRFRQWEQQVKLKITRNQSHFFFFFFFFSTNYFIYNSSYPNEIVFIKNWKLKAKRSKNYNSKLSRTSTNEILLELLENRVIFEGWAFFYYNKKLFRRHLINCFFLSVIKN